MFPYVVAATALGIAQGAVEQFAEDTRHRVTSYSTTLLADHATTQARLGEAAAAVDAAELLLVIELRARHGGTPKRRACPTMEEKIRLRRDGAYAARLCTRAVDLLFEAGGGEFLYEDKPMQRCVPRRARGARPLRAGVGRRGVHRRQVHARHRAGYCLRCDGQARPATAASRSIPAIFAMRSARFATGVTVVTIVAPNGAPIGLTCNSFSSVSLSPPLVLWSLSLRSPNLVELPAGAALRNQHPRRRPGRDRQPLRAVDREQVRRRAHTAVGTGGVPLIENAAAQLECRNETRYYSGDHVIFIGHVLHYACRDCAPLVFCRGRYTEPGLI